MIWLLFRIAADLESMSWIKADGDFYRRPTGTRTATTQTWLLLVLRWKYLHTWAPIKPAMPKPASMSAAPVSPYVEKTNVTI